LEKTEGAIEKNPEKQATLGTIHRTKKKNSRQKTKKMSSKDPS
jgi:hypothetical protein